MYFASYSEQLLKYILIKRAFILLFFLSYVMYVMVNFCYVCEYGVEHRTNGNVHVFVSYPKYIHRTQAISRIRQSRLILCTNVIVMGIRACEIDKN